MNMSESKLESIKSSGESCAEWNWWASKPKSPFDFSFRLCRWVNIFSLETKKENVILESKLNVSKLGFTYHIIPNIFSAQYFKRNSF